MTYAQADFAQDFAAHRVAANYSFDVTLVAGTTYTLQLSGSCITNLRAAAAFLADSSASCEASHSAYWNGLTNIRDLAGNPIGGLRPTSASGFDYCYASSLSPHPASSSPVASVPEPASWALLIAGFALTGAMRRRRRSTLAA